MIRIVATLVLVAGGPGAAAQDAADAVVLEAKSLSRPELPDGFPLDALHEGFAVLSLKVVNNGSGTVTLDPAAIEVLEEGRRKRSRARSTDVTPKLMKRYAKRPLGIGGEIFSGGQLPPDITGRPPDRSYRTSTIGSSGGPGVINVETAGLIRKALEAAEIQPATLGPGETLEGLFYVEAKDTGASFSGEVQWDGRRAVF